MSDPEVPDAPEVPGAPEAPDAPDAPDGLDAALAVVGQRWVLRIVDSLRAAPLRYGDLQRELGIPTNILATRLRELEQAGVLYRLPLKHNTRAYALTERGADLGAALDALRQWGDGLT